MSNNTDDLQLASMRSRATAFVIDDLLVTAIILIIFWNNIMAVSHDVNAMMYFMKTDLVMPLIFLKLVYQTVFVWYYGATIGKIVTKIRVIDSNNWFTLYNHYTNKKYTFKRSTFFFHSF